MSAVLVITPSHRTDATLAIAAARAGETGILDIGFSPDRAGQKTAIADLARHASCQAGESVRGTWGVRWDQFGEADENLVVLRELLDGRSCPVLILAGLDFDRESLSQALNAGRGLAGQILLEVFRLDQAELAQQTGFDGVVAKGHEAAGRVSHESTFLLLQRLHARLEIPFWVQGGIGPDTAAAAFLAGAAGIVLGEQLWLATESPLDAAERRQVAQFDGSETTVLADDRHAFRFLARRGQEALHELERIRSEGGDWLKSLGARLRAPHSELAGHEERRLIPLGQEIGFARRLAERFVNVAGILQAYRSRIEANLAAARKSEALGPDGPLAKSHGTKYPILQGPMTRVSDDAAFCEAVAKDGALPFLALALMRGEETRELLTATNERLAGRPWGVGILGFVPLELRSEQLAAVHDVPPSYVIIAGGRPSQARDLEARKIPTYLHVPSPGLLEEFIREGARKFLFEGRECGGHVGPRTSFCLWQLAIDVLMEAKLEKAEEFRIVFAGGIHDGLSAAMVTALAGRLTDAGMQIGVLMGTGYLFTHEAVACGAITEEFQRQALACEETVLLESSVGHATRCVKSPFAEEFYRRKHELIRAGKSNDEIRVELELFNIGRLRIASKGVDRPADAREQQRQSQLVAVDLETQRRNGMYMIGQVAGLRSRSLSMADFHAEVSAGSVDVCRRLAARPLPWQKAQAMAAKPVSTADIAVVGMACMFPKANDLREYWQNIVNRVDAVEEVPAERWRHEDFFSEDRFEPDRVYSKWGGFVGKIVFDPMKWRIPPASLLSIEPIQLLSLEVAARAMADAGYDRRDFPRERSGVIFACAGSHEQGSGYSFRTMMRQYLPLVKDLPAETRDRIYASLEEQLPEWTEDSFPGFLLNVIAGRIARELNLNGPNYVVDAACAASLAALHAAIEQLRSGTSDMMLVGAADATNNPFCYMCFSKTHALSPKGRSRPFDEAGDGIGLGEGIGVMVIKRLADAERDGDKIYAVIKGIGASSDGKNRSLTAPHPPGQAKAVVRAYTDAEISPATVSLIEAHGTGTVVGDSAELTTLIQVFAPHTEARQFAAVGSVKSMIGHTKTVAGLASLIKTVLAVKHGVLPATIGVEKPTTRVDFTQSPFYVNTETRPWINDLGDHPRRAGVSAFGFGGTNFHVVLEEYTGAYHASTAVDLTPRKAELLVWQRGTRAEIVQELTQLETRLAAVATDDLAGLASALTSEENNRTGGNHAARLGIVASSIDDLRQKAKRAATLLADRDSIVDPSGIYYSEAAPADPRSVCFLYPGQGSQSLNMLGDLLLSSPWAHEMFAEANRQLADFLPQPLSRYIYPAPVFDDVERQAQFKALSDTRVAQPALGLVELFATALLRRFGIEPGMVAGHSYGEHVAIHAAGCLSPADLLWLSAKRGEVCADAAANAAGGMVAVRADAATTATLLKELEIDATLANLNSPDQTIIAGRVEAIESAVVKLNARDVRAKRIPVSAAFHSPLLHASAATMSGHFAKTTFQKPQLPVYSNTTGGAHGDDPDSIRQLLTRHFDEPVLFEKEIRQIRAWRESLSK